MAKLAAGNAPNGFRVGDWCLSMISKLGETIGQRTRESFFWALYSAQYRYPVLDLSTA
ncbi:hypothetical protein BS47DRAFT_1352863 [Hydnum rufescens UP504]|uniref:Uncharacterized protein n=1 Tax=Hydnum rufescens UP504 TaxID=1448309 RepID=A0A9P6DPG4_9AGAM|nr:hypothetical protein BS47DRAFT_1352863 [Hydnum rufescens UP504]